MSIAPARRRAAAEYARERGADATSGHDVSATYGLRARTRTAALNAAILPRMIRTSQMTASAVERAAIAAPLMIMRSDGGVMDVREIERRPILTLLSGPAAGVAGALLYDNVSDGIFVEVGGTSSDCSAIRAGRPQMRAAKIGGHRAMLRTLDVRTLGIAGGSMAKIVDGAVVDVGPRSAHIAGCAYACFVDAALMDGARVDEESEYAVIVARDGTRVAVTPTCAANLLNAVPSDAFARGNAVSALLAFALLVQRYGGDAESLARQILDIAARKLRAGIDELIADYALDPGHVVVVGGGGGAGSIVPYTVESMGLPWRIARDAEVISPIGVALALVRDVVERIVVNPSPEEIAHIRREAADRVVAAGASPDRVEVQVEIDSQRNLVRATASGATEIAESAALPVATEGERRAAAARSMRCRARRPARSCADGTPVRLRTLSRRARRRRTRCGSLGPARRGNPPRACRRRRSASTPSDRSGHAIRRRGTRGSGALRTARRAHCGVRGPRQRRTGCRACLRRNRRL